MTHNMTPIQIGESTHIHFQSIIWVNFKTIKVIVNRPENPIPELLDDVFPILT